MERVSRQLGRTVAEVVRGILELLEREILPRGSEIAQLGLQVGIQARDEFLPYSPALPPGELWDALQREGVEPDIGHWPLLQGLEKAPPPVRAFAARLGVRARSARVGSALRVDAD